MASDDDDTRDTATFYRHEIELLINRALFIRDPFMARSWPWTRWSKRVAASDEALYRFYDIAAAALTRFGRKPTMLDNTTTPSSVWSGSFHLFGIEVKCHTLSDGQRIIEAESFHNLMEAMDTPGGTVDTDMEEFAKWQRG